VVKKAATAPDLAVNLAGIRMKNPVLVASGTFGYGPEYADVVDLNKLGGIMVKGVRAVPWDGNAAPRMVEVPGGLVNAIGLQGPGVDGFVSEYMPFLRRHDTAVIVNIWGDTIDEYAEVAGRLSDVEGIHGIEVNVSCPNIKEGGIAFGTNPVTLAALVERVRARTALPLVVKLPPNLPDIRAFAHIAQEAGSDALSLVNTMPAMVIDPETRRPVLSNVVGGLSGPALHPVAVRLVWEAAQAVHIPIVGMGGITGVGEAVEFLVAGAAAVAVGTANFTDPTTAPRLVDELAAYLSAHGMRAVGDLVGSLKL